MDNILRNLKQNSKRYNNLNNQKIKFNIKFLALNHSFKRFIIFRNSKFIVVPQNKIKNTLISKTIKYGLFLMTMYTLYAHRQRVQKFILSFQSEHFNNNVKKYIHYLLLSDEIREGGLDLLENIFQNKYSKQATVELLDNLLKDPYVMENTKIYGISLFNELLKEEELKNEFKKLVIDLLQMQEIKLESLDLLKHILEKEESKDILSQYFKVIFLRSDMIKSLSSVITDSALYTMNSQTTKKKFAEFILDVWSDPDLRWFVIKKSFNFWQASNASIKIEDLQAGDLKIIREELKSLHTLNFNEEKNV